MEGCNFSKQDRFYMFTTFLLLGCMLGTTICGSIFISDVKYLSVIENDAHGIHFPSLKKFGYPAVIGLPLLPSIILGFCLLKFRNCTLFASKFITNLINIMLRVFILVHAEIVVKDLQYCKNITNDLSERRGVGFGDELGFGPRCTLATVSRSKVEYVLFLLVSIFESMVIMTLVANCIFYCARCRKVCSENEEASANLDTQLMQLEHCNGE